MYGIAYWKSWFRCNLSGINAFHGVVMCNLVSIKFLSFFSLLLLEYPVNETVYVAIS